MKPTFTKIIAENKNKMLKKQSQVNIAATWYNYSY